MSTDNAESGFWVDGYVPPIPKGARVRATAENELIAEGSLGTVTWHHPAPTMPYRVKWDDFRDKAIRFGMDDIGWLQHPNEIEVI